MRYSIILVFCSCMVACQQENRVFADKVAVADSIAINYFAGNGRPDSVVAVKIVRNLTQMGQLSNFIAASPAAEQSCGVDGSIHYFKRGVVLQDVDFRMNDVQCMHFRFVVEGKAYNTQLSPEAKQLLVSFR